MHQVVCKKPLIWVGLASAVLVYPCVARASSSSGSLGNMKIEIADLRSQEGFVCIALFDKPDGFPTDMEKAVDYHCFDIDASPLEVSFDRVQFGEYALSVLHDENGDRQLNTGILGIPKEGIAFSQNPRIRRKTTFSDTSFLFEENSPPVRVDVKYFLNNSTSAANVVERL